MVRPEALLISMIIIFDQQVMILLLIFAFQLHTVHYSHCSLWLLFTGFVWFDV